MLSLDPLTDCPGRYRGGSIGLRRCSPAAELSLPFDIVIYRPENVALFSGAAGDDGVEIHACAVIFGTFPHRSPVLVLEIGFVSVSV